MRIASHAIENSRSLAASFGAAKSKPLKAGTNGAAESSAVPTHLRTALTLINPVYNISAEKVDAAIAHFKR